MKLRDYHRLYDCAGLIQGVDATRYRYLNVCYVSRVEHDAFAAEAVSESNLDDPYMGTLETGIGSPNRSSRPARGDAPR